MMKKVVLVTGGASGIGSSIAKVFLANSYDVVVFDVLSSLDYETIPGMDYVRGDVSDYSAVDRLFVYLVEKYKKLDVLVCNAGILIEGNILTITVEEFKRILDVNTISVFYFMQKAALIMKESGFGRILVSSSFATIIPSLNSGIYASSKLALDSLVRVMAAECGKYGITVNSYAPGMVPTNMSGIDHWDVERRNRMIQTLAIPYFGNPQDIANLLLFLASDLSSYITGSKIDISGGKFAVQVSQK